MSRWFRHYAGMMSDPKFGGVARFCKRSRAEVLFVWGCLLESASEYDSAVYSFDADAMADLLGIETEEAQAIHDGLEAKGLIEGGRIASWDKRQFKSDDSAPRVKAFRQRQKTASEADKNGDVTLHTVTVTPPETEADTETDTANVVDQPTVAAPSAAERRVRKPKPERPSHKPIWETDPDFCAAWDACTDRMRKRSESREKTWVAWGQQAVKAGGSATLCGCVLAYVRGDDDVKRTGGPGFHVWLKEGRWEHWLSQAATLTAIPMAWTGPPEIRNAVVSETSGDFARSYLDTGAWKDGAIIPRTGYAAGKLLQLRCLRAHGVTILQPQGAAA